MMGLRRETLQPELEIGAVEGGVELLLAGELIDGGRVAEAGQAGAGGGLGVEERGGEAEGGQVFRAHVEG